MCIIVALISWTLIIPWHLTTAGWEGWDLYQQYNQVTIHTFPLVYTLINVFLLSDALIYVEVEAELAALETPTNWLLIKEKKAGQVLCQLYQRQAN